MEFLPEDPKKRVVTLVVLGVLVLAVAALFYFQFAGGGPGTVENEQPGAGQQVPQPSPDVPPGVGRGGGLRTATPGN